MHLPHAEDLAARPGYLGCALNAFPIPIWRDRFAFWPVSYAALLRLAVRFEVNVESRNCTENDNGEPALRLWSEL